MSWFKKPLDGDDLMMNANSSRSGAPEPSLSRPEPRVPGAEPRSPAPRISEPSRIPDAKAAEPASRASVLGPTLKFRGELSAQEDLIVNIRATAKVKGNVFAPRVGISEGAFFQGQIEMQPSGAAVQEHSARLRQATMSPPIEAAAVDQMLGGS
jgi:hypothetical protein